MFCLEASLLGVSGAARPFAPLGPGRRGTWPGVEFLVSADGQRRCDGKGGFFVFSMV